MIRAEVNAGDTLKSILNVRDFTSKFKCNHYFINAGDSPPIPRNGNVWPEMQCKLLFTLTFHTVGKRQSFVIPFIADIRN